jgi:Carboxypeptidase regulatory-like domain
VGITQIGVGAGRQIAGPFRVDASAAWIHGTGMTLNLAITTYLPSLRAVSRNTYTPSAGVQGTQLFEGSVLWNARDQRLSFDNGQSVGRAGITGVAFVDRNGNGRQDPDEPGLSHILLRVGSRAVSTDSAGRFTVWDLVPFTTTIIEVDTLSVRDPLLVPLAVTQRLTPLPNSFRYVPIPFAEGGEVSGTVLFPDGRGVSTVPVELHNRATGRVLRTTSFSDGTFYTYGVPPGKYTVTLAADALERLGMQAASATLEIPLTGERKSVEGIVVRLTKRE